MAMVNSSVQRVSFGNFSTREQYVLGNALNKINRVYGDFAFAIAEGEEMVLSYRRSLPQEPVCVKNTYVDNITGLERTEYSFVFPHIENCPHYSFKNINGEAVFLKYEGEDYEVLGHDISLVAQSISRYLKKT